MKPRVRFCPSPTGNPHVGLARTALFNWVYARHHGGTYVFRIEDTDAARDSQESYVALVDALRWLGLDWDEGPEVGGPHAPYRQSERMPLYAEIGAKLLAGGHAYQAFSTPEEVEARHRAAGRDPKLGYDNFDRDLTDVDRERFRAEGRQPVLRVRMPDEATTWTDLIRGEITYPAGSVPDFVIMRGDGAPLYTLTNPVDDALMQITHVLRGEDLLPSTPRQIALYRALIAVGVTEFVPSFGHLPYVMGEGNKKLSKRDPSSDLLGYRSRGYLPAGLVNYLGLLGWSIAPDRDVFTLDEMVAAFDLDSVSANPARFDPRKLDAINAAHIRALPLPEFVAAIEPFLADAGLVSSPPSEEQDRLLATAAPLIQERVTVLTQAVEMLRFLFVGSSFAPDADAAAKVLGPDAAPVLSAAVTALESVPWQTPEIEAALKSALIDGLGLKPKKAFAPIRVAVTGRTVSPPLYESMELLGRDLTLSRLRAGL